MEGTSPKLHCFKTMMGSKGKEQRERGAFSRVPREESGTRKVTKEKGK